jgi:hypothetical protein
MKILKYKILIVALAGLMLFGCAEEFLELDPPTLTEEGFYLDDNNIYMSIIGCYDVLGWDGNHVAPIYFMGDILGRDSYKGGENSGDQGWIHQLYTFNYSSTVKQLPDYWRNMYIGINRCNKLLENIDKNQTLTEGEINRYKGEASFLRAYYHFQLVKLFGEVPLIDHLLGKEEYIQKKATKEALYDFIEKDLEFAAENLPAYPGTKEDYTKGRVTMDAAKAMLARVHLYQKEFADVKRITDEIIAETNHDLLSDYGKVFAADNEHNQELMFEIEFDGHIGEWGNESNGNILIIYMQSREKTVAKATGWGFNCPTKEFIAEFEEGDPRLKATVIQKGDTLYKGTEDELVYLMDDAPTAKAANWVNNPDKTFNRKYNVPYSQQKLSNGTGDSQGKNWIVMRFSDVLLMNAEANVHLKGDWQTPLNRVRSRVGLGATPVADPLDAVYHERRVELGMEGQRFWDLVRSGRGEEILGSEGFIEGTHNHFPIPQEHLDDNGGSF